MPDWSLNKGFDLHSGQDRNIIWTLLWIIFINSGDFQIFFFLEALIRPQVTLDPRAPQCGRLLIFIYNRYQHRSGPKILGLGRYLFTISSMLVTDSACWWPIQYIGKITNVMILPPTSEISHHHKVTNDVSNITVTARSHRFTHAALVRAKFFFWTSFKCTFGLFDGSFFFVRLFLNIIEPHPSVKWRGYTVSVLPEAGLITVGIILTGINWGWVEGKEVWCLPLWLFFFFLLHVKDWLKHLLQVGIRPEYGL